MSSGMAEEPIADLVTLIAVARERSFTRAAAKLGVSPSALSHTIRSLEERLGVRLLNRTTRSVSPTEAGELLLNAIEPKFDDIRKAIDRLGELRDRPAGTIRINSVDHAAETVLWPSLSRFLAKYPDISVEITVENSLTDIVGNKYDAGIRMGERVARDMIAVPIGPEIRMAAVATPGYFSKNPKPKNPQDLSKHSCINMRLPTRGGVYAWEFEKGSREVHVRVEGQLTLNDMAVIRRAALEGVGLAFVPEDMVLQELKSGKLVRVLNDWTPSFPGYHLYYPSRRQPSAAFALIVEALRYRREQH